MTSSSPLTYRNSVLILHAEIGVNRNAPAYFFAVASGLRQYSIMVQGQGWRTPMMPRLPRGSSRPCPLTYAHVEAGRRLAHRARPARNNFALLPITRLPRLPTPHAVDAEGGAHPVEQLAA